VKLTQWIQEAQTLLAENGDLDVVHPAATSGADVLRHATLTVEKVGNSDTKMVAVRGQGFYEPKK
jgi:hypothetical protein